MNDNKIKQVYHHKPILDKPINSSFTEFLYKQVHKLMPILGGGVGWWSGAHIDEDVFGQILHFWPDSSFLARFFIFGHITQGGDCTCLVGEGSRHSRTFTPTSR